MSVRDNIADVQRLIEQIKEHPMCAKFSDSDGVFLVVYPPGFFPDGVKACYKSSGKIVTMRRMIDAMERHWRHGLPNNQQET